MWIWDNAAWRAGARVRARIEAHDRRAKAEGGARVVAGSPPGKEPWPDAIEPRWVRCKRAIVDPDRRLTAAEVVERVCGYYGSERLDRPSQQVV